MSTSWYSPDAFAFWAILISVLIYIGVLAAKWFLDRPRSPEQRAMDAYCSRVDEELDELERARRARRVRDALDGVGRDADRVVFLYPAEPVPFAPRDGGPQGEFFPRRPAA